MKICKQITYKILQTDSFERPFYQTYPKTVSLSWIPAFGEVELLLRMLSNTPAALPY